jgi:phage shock protein A
MLDSGDASLEEQARKALVRQWQEDGDKQEATMNQIMVVTTAMDSEQIKKKLRTTETQVELLVSLNEKLEKALKELQDRIHIRETRLSELQQCIEKQQKAVETLTQQSEGYKRQLTVVDNHVNTMLNSEPARQAKLEMKFASLGAQEMHSQQIQQLTQRMALLEEFRTVAQKIPQHMRSYRQRSVEVANAIEPAGEYNLNRLRVSR